MRFCVNILARLVREVLEQLFRPFYAFACERLWHDWMKFDHSLCCGHRVSRLFIMEKGMGTRRFGCTKCSCVLRVTT